MTQASSNDETHELDLDLDPGPAPRRHEQEESIKETIESIVIALILAFVFRAYVVEAFVIPTGSMAPTLLGRHVRLACDQCGYEFTVDPDEGTNVFNNALRDSLEFACPMCRNKTVARRGMRVSAGDRILVHKYLYSFSEPRRWDVVVFKNPRQPYVNYIKRLVGLPNEKLWIRDGNLYVKSPADEAFHVARKADRPDVQRAVWQPVYHSRYFPLDHDERTTGRYRWQLPWEAAQGHWDLDGREGYICEDEAGGTLTFDFSAVLPPSGHWYAYNQVKQNGQLPPEPIEDLRIAAAIQPAADGLSVTLETTARLGLDSLDAGVLPLRATIEASGNATLSTIDPNNRARSVVLDQVNLEPFQAGIATSMELWYVDQEASLWINGEKVLVWRYDLDFETIRRRPRPAMSPQVSIHVKGAPVTLQHVQVDRDIYYSDTSYQSPSRPARGSTRSYHGLRAQPVELGPDHFLCFGDNSPLSLDSRYWEQPNGWIEHRYFDDWIDQGNDPGGLVPRELMMGRAFFVYFPAPYGLDTKSRGFIPNFGNMRFIH